MRIKRKPLIFHNVLSICRTAPTGKWYGLAIAMREFMIKNGLCPTGPIFYQAQPQSEGQTIYTVYIPLQLQIELDAESPFKFLNELSFEDGLLLRHSDIDEPLEPSCNILETCAKVNRLHLQNPFYNLYLDVYGDGVIDIYAPVIKR